VALALDAASVAGAVGHLALAHRNVALGALPALLAVAHSSSVMSVCRAQDRTDAWKNKGEGVQMVRKENIFKWKSMSLDQHSGSRILGHLNLTDN